MGGGPGESAGRAAPKPSSCISKLRIELPPPPNDVCLRFLSRQAQAATERAITATAPHIAGGGHRGGGAGRGVGSLSYAVHRVSVSVYDGVCGVTFATRTMCVIDEACSTRLWLESWGSTGRDGGGGCTGQQPRCRAVALGRTLVSRGTRTRCGCSRGRELGRGPGRGLGRGRGRRARGGARTLARGLSRGARGGFVDFEARGGGDAQAAHRHAARRELALERAQRRAGRLLVRPALGHVPRDLDAARLHLEHHHANGAHADLRGLWAKKGVWTRTKARC